MEAKTAEFLNILLCVLLRFFTGLKFRPKKLIFQFAPKIMHSINFLSSFAKKIQQHFYSCSKPRLPEVFSGNAPQLYEKEQERDVFSNSAKRSLVYQPFSTFQLKLGQYLKVQDTILDYLLKFNFSAEKW